MAFEYRTGIQMVLPSIDVYDIILMYCDLKTGPVFKWSYHLKSGHQKVRFSDESGIQVFGIQMDTVSNRFKIQILTAFKFERNGTGFGCGDVFKTYTKMGSIYKYIWIKDL